MAKRRYLYRVETRRPDEPWAHREFEPGCETRIVRSAAVEFPAEPHVLAHYGGPDG